MDSLCRLWSERRVACVGHRTGEKKWQIDNCIQWIIGTKLGDIGYLTQLVITGHAHFYLYTISELIQREAAQINSLSSLVCLNGNRALWYGKSEYRIAKIGRWCYDNWDGIRLAAGNYCACQSSCSRDQIKQTSAINSELCGLYRWNAALDGIFTADFEFLTALRL